ncbi:MAG: GNAT family N-acetyltransferase [Halobacteriales archaeon]
MPGPAFLHGEDVTLRTIEEADIDFLQENVNDPGIWRAIGRSRPVNRTQEAEFYESVVADDDSIQLLITVDGTAVGMISLQPINQQQGHAEIEFWIAEAHRQEGYGTEAARLMVGYAFDQLRLHKVIGQVFAFNDPSRRLFERLGFTQESVHREEQFVDGEYHDIYWYGILESEWTD